MYDIERTLLEECVKEAGVLTEKLRGIPTPVLVSMRPVLQHMEEARMWLSRCLEEFDENREFARRMTDEA